MIQQKRKPEALSRVFAISCHVFRQLLAAQQVEVQVLDALAAVLADIGDHAVAITKPRDLGDLGDGRKDGGNKVCGLGRHLVSGRDVRLGNDENVDRRLRRDVVERVNAFVLVHLLGGDHPCDDLTKQAIVHDSSPLCACALARWRIL